MNSDLVSEIRGELHSRLDSIIDRLLITARAEALSEISGKLGEISELPAFRGLESPMGEEPPEGNDVPFATDRHASPGSRATDPSTVLAIINMRDQGKFEWNEIVGRLNQTKVKTVTGVPWSRDNVVKLYQTAKAKLRKQSDGRKLQGKYMGLLRSVPKNLQVEAKSVRAASGIHLAVRFLEGKREEIRKGRKASTTSKASKVTKGKTKRRPA